MLLLAFVLTGASNVWADVETLDFAAQGYENAQQITETSGMVVKATFTNGGTATAYYNTGTAVRVYNGGTMTISAGENLITQIVFTYELNGTATVSVEGKTNSGSYDDATKTWTGSDTEVVLTAGTAKHVRISKVEVTYTSGGDTPTDTRKATTVTIDASGISNDMANGNTAGQLTASVTTQDGAPITGATVTWASSNEGVASIDEDGNVTLEDLGETTITATYAGDEANYKGSSATYKLTVIDSGDILTIAEVRAQGTGNVFTKGVVTSCVGTTAYIQDATAAICVYGNNTLTVGDEITVSGELTTYNGLLEIKNPIVEVLSSGNAVEPTVKTIAEINADYATDNALQGLFVKIEEATVTAINGSNTTIVQGENTIVVRGITGVELAVDDVVTLEGNIGCYNDAQIANPQNIIVKEIVTEVSKPVFSPEGGTFDAAQSVTISCDTDEAKIYYTLDGTEPTDQSTEYTGAINVTETATIMAIAYKGSDKSAVATATYTIVSLQTIAAVRAQGTGNVFTKGVVTSCSGTTAYIQDATAAICVYGKALTVSDEITVSGTLTTYNGLLEIKDPVVDVISSNNRVQPTVKTIAEINADYAAENALQGLFVKIEEATITAISGKNTTIEQNGSSLVVYNIPSDVQLTVDDIITVEGNIGCYNAAQIVNPQNITVKASEDPIIKAENVTLDYDVTSGEIAFTIENGSPTYGPTVTSDAEWISDIVVMVDKITFTTTVNDGDADRVATMTISYGEVTKEVTVTQKHFVVDYAALPFVFTGVKADIESTDGLTHSGLGTDYASGNPRLKFDGTGDYVILKINEAPSALAFDVKGNGSPWAGNFTVQVSADGETYSDLATYTELGATQTEVFMLSSDVRYIKWIYTEKSSGNVGLGNIKVVNSYLATIGDAGYATFVTAWPVDFSQTNVTAYVVSAVNESSVTLAEVTTVPVNTPLILKGEAGDYELSIVEYADAVENNELLPSDGTVTGDGTIYALGLDKSIVTHAVYGFYKVATNATVPAGKAYLKVGASVRDFLAFTEGEADGVNVIENGRLTIDNAVFDLTGRRVVKSAKGLYIVNGKKIVK